MARWMMCPSNGRQWPIAVRPLSASLDPLLTSDELIRAVYVKARYSRHCRITREELDWLEERVTHLRNLIREVSLARISELEQAA